MKRKKLPKPRHKMGYTAAELDALMPDMAERKRFNKQFGCQTCMIDAKTGETIYYTWDVEKCLAIVRGERGPMDSAEWD